MHRALFLLLALFSSLSLRAQHISISPIRIEGPDTNAYQLAHEVIDAMGGDSAWGDRSWSLAFDFVVEAKGKEMSRYSHQWNRATGEYIVGGRTREGKAWQVEFSNIYEKQGRATIDGEPVPDTTLSRILSMAYARFINDTYWMLMPVKMLDPGVMLERRADTTIGGVRYNVLLLSFRNVGLTPGDRYLVFINPQTKLVERWHYMLESGREADYLWTDYRRFDPVVISLKRESPDGSSIIRFDNVRVWRNE